jgi:hypothetical protein
MSMIGAAFQNRPSEHQSLSYNTEQMVLVINLSAGPSVHAVWDVGLDRLDDEIMGSNPT